jgi:hypothetical protein
LRQRQLAAGVAQQRQPVVGERVVERPAAVGRGVHPLDERQPLHEHRPGRDAPLQLAEGVRPVRVDGRPEQELRVAARQLRGILVGHRQVRVCIVRRTVLGVHPVEGEGDGRVQLRRLVDRAGQPVLEVALDPLVAAEQRDAEPDAGRQDVGPFAEGAG